MISIGGNGMVVLPHQGNRSDRDRFLADFVEYGRPFLADDVAYEPEAVEKRLSADGLAGHVTALREAGCVILGKVNLSEWANLRGAPSSGGWSARGGQCLNPHVLTMSPSGSSSGSGASVAAGFAPLAVGSETDGSIVSPSHACGIVGVKPTVGLVSRTGMIPISAGKTSPLTLARACLLAAFSSWCLPWQLSPRVSLPQSRTQRVR